MNFWKQIPTEKIKYKQKVSGAVILSASWTIGPTGPTLGTPVNTETDTEVLVSDLMEGMTYTLTVHLTCADGQEFNSSARIECKAR